MAEPLSDHWEHVLGTITRAESVLLACDFDGTLAPIVERPEDARILPAASAALLELAQRPRYRVAIVSGRALVDVQRLAMLPGVLYAGNHGMEIHGPGVARTDQDAGAAQPVLRALMSALNGITPRYGGSFVEDKGLSLSVHYRRLSEPLQPDFVREVEGTLKAARADSLLDVVMGKKVIDVRPAAGWHKGRAVAFLLETVAGGPDGANHLPVYIGDDTTDEDAFREVSARGGVAILAGPAERVTAARYRVDSPDDVARFLQSLLDAE